MLTYMLKVTINCLSSFSNSFDIGLLVEVHACVKCLRLASRHFGRTRVAIALSVVLVKHHSARDCMHHYLSSPSSS